MDIESYILKEYPDIASEMLAELLKYPDLVNAEDWEVRMWCISVDGYLWIKQMNESKK